MKEPLRLKVGCTKGQEINGRESGLLARGNEDNDGELGRVLADGVVDWLHHSNETRLRVGDVETLDVQVERHGADVWMKAEEAMGGRSKPLTEVLGIGN